MKLKKVFSFLFLICSGYLFGQTGGTTIIPGLLKMPKGGVTGYVLTDSAGIYAVWKLSLPNQTSHANQLLKTDGTNTSWVTKSSYIDTVSNSINLPGSPTTTTQSSGDNSTKVATTAFVKVQGYVTGPGTSGQVAYFNGPNSVTSDTNFRWNAGGRYMTLGGIGQSFASFQPQVQITKNQNGYTFLNIENQNDSANARVGIILHGKPTASPALNAKVSQLQLTSSTFGGGSTVGSVTPANTLILSSGGDVPGGVVIYSDDGPIQIKNNLHVKDNPAFYMNPYSKNGIPQSYPSFIAIKKKPLALDSIAAKAFLHIGADTVGALVYNYQFAIDPTAAVHSVGIMDGGFNYWSNGTSGVLLHGHKSNGSTIDDQIYEGTTPVTNGIPFYPRNDAGTTSADFTWDDSGHKLTIGDATTPFNSLFGLNVIGTITGVVRGINIENHGTGNSSCSPLYISESVTNYSYMTRYHSSFSGNIISSIPFANTTLFNQVVTNNGAGNTMNWAANHWNVCGTTTTNLGTHLSSAGLLIDQTANLNNAANYALDVKNGDVGIGTTGKALRYHTGSAGDMAGQVAIVTGTKAITITGLTDSDLAFITVATYSGGITGVKYTATCTSNTLTITSITAAGVTDTNDVSTINYFIVRPY